MSKQRDDEQMWCLTLFGQPEGAGTEGMTFTFPLMTRVDACQVRDIIMLKCGDLVSTALSYGPPMPSSGSALEWPSEWRVSDVVSAWPGHELSFAGRDEGGQEVIKALCSCGWEGLEFGYLSNAQAEGAHHMQSTLPDRGFDL